LDVNVIHKLRLKKPSIKEEQTIQR